MTNLQLFPRWRIGLEPPFELTVTAIAASFIFGILLNFGIGHYAPSLVMLSLMGLDPSLPFPSWGDGRRGDHRWGGHASRADRANRP